MYRHYIKTLTLAGVVALAGTTAAQADCADHLSAGADLWLEPNDSLAAMLEPDCYAWQLFVALSWPGNVATQSADAGKALGDDGLTTWELWRNVRRGSQDAVFSDSGTDPGPWLTGATAVASRDASEFDALALQQLALLGGGAMPQIDDDSPFGNETRMNETTYTFVRDNTLYNTEGLQAAFDPASGVMNFPANAKEIKARWRIITEAEKPRYHWVDVVNSAGTTRPFGLTALHITTKDLPNWFWATFEHVDNKDSAVGGGVPGHEGWLAPSFDAYTCPNAPSGCDKAPAVVSGTKWENYVLRGTQIDFVDSRGRPTILANSVIERGFQDSSSCITCHARAAYDASGTFNGFFNPPPAKPGSVGAPDPNWFFSGQTVTTMQTDFIWSLMRACSSTTANSCR